MIYISIESSECVDYFFWQGWNDKIISWDVTVI